MENPYAPGVHAGDPAVTGQVSPGTLQALAATRPWVRLCSIIGFVGAGLTGLAACGMLIGGAAGRLGGPEFILGIPYLIMGVVYLIPAIKLWKYGSAIVRLMSSSALQDLEEALQQQRGFWKFTGIMILIMIGLMLFAVGTALFSVAAIRREL